MERFQQKLIHEMGLLSRLRNVLGDLRRSNPRNQTPVLVDEHIKLVEQNYAPPGPSFKYKNLWQTYKHFKVFDERFKESKKYPAKANLLQKNDDKLLVTIFACILKTLSEERRKHGNCFHNQKAKNHFQLIPPSNQNNPFGKRRFYYGKKSGNQYKKIINSQRSQKFKHNSTSRCNDSSFQMPRGKCSESSENLFQQNTRCNFFVEQIKTFSCISKRFIYKKTFQQHH